MLLAPLFISPIPLHVRLRSSRIAERARLPGVAQDGGVAGLTPDSARLLPGGEDTEVACLGGEEGAHGEDGEEGPGEGERGRCSRLGRAGWWLMVGNMLAGGSVLLE